MTNLNIDQPDLQPVSPQPPMFSNAVPDATLDTDRPKNKHSKFRIIIPVLAIIIALLAVATYLTTSHHQTATTKKDIPYLTYAVANGGNLSTIYPLETVDSASTFQVNSQLFEGLVRYQNQTKIIPLLATSWYNPDNTTWIFNIRHGVKFHSGRTMTANDVKYSLDYAVAHQNDNDGSVLQLASTISKVQVVNSYQVKITTQGPDPVLLNRLASLLIFDSKGQLGNPDNGTGPYIIKPGTKPTSITVDLQAVTNYWGGHIYTRAVHFQTVTNANQLATDTANGKYDIAGDFDTKELAKIKNYQPIIVPDLGITFLGLNTVKANSPLQSLAARQAVAYALNIPAVLKAGNLQGTPANQLIPLAIPGYDPSIRSTPYNPTKARQLLASVKNAAAPLTLSYQVGNEGQLAEIAKELSAVGFNVKLSATQSLNDLVDQAIGGQTDMFYLTYTSNTLDGLDIISSTVAGTQNYSNSELNDLVTQASSTLDPASRIAIIQKIERLVNSNVPVVPLYTVTRTYALTKPYVINVDVPSNDTGTYFWQTYQR